MKNSPPDESSYPVEVATRYLASIRQDLHSSIDQLMSEVVERASASIRAQESTPKSVIIDRLLRLEREVQNIRETKGFPQSAGPALKIAQDYLSNTRAILQELEIEETIR